MQDWKADAMEYRGLDLAAQDHAEKRIALHDYIGKIRNKSKQDYARRYLRWRDGRIVGFDIPGSGGPEDPQGPASSLSYMARQSVRMRIDGLFDK